MANLYRRRTQLTEAIQFFKNTRGAVLILVGPDNFKEESWGQQKRYYLLRSNGEWCSLFPGEWVTKQGNAIWSYSRDNFDLFFEEADELMPA
jgi:hypothetical protein